MGMAHYDMRDPFWRGKRRITGFQYMCQLFWGSLSILAFFLVFFFWFCCYSPKEENRGKRGNFRITYSLVLRCIHDGMMIGNQGDEGERCLL